MTLGSRVAVMRDGTVQQVDTPQTLYREPVNLFVAAFIGSPSMNLVEAEVSAATVEFAGFRIPLDAGRRPAGGEDDGDPRDPAAGLRGRADCRPRRCRGSRSMRRSSRSSARPRTSSSPSRRRRSTSTRSGRRPTTASARRCSRPTAAPSSRPRSRRRRACARATGSARARSGRLHFFDPETGESLRADRRRPQPAAAAGGSGDREARVDDRCAEPLRRAGAEARRGRPSGRTRPEDDRARQGQARLCRRRPVEGLAAARELDARSSRRPAPAPTPSCASA